MAITTRDQAIAGMKPPVMFHKAGITMAASASNRAYTPWYVAGNPGASTANAAGVNGAALTPASAAVEGRLIRANPAGGTDAYIANLMVNANPAGTLMLVDRLWHNSGLSVTLTTAQAITPAALPARDADASTLGNRIIAGIEWSTVGGAGTPTVTLTYTNQAGTAGQTTAFTGVTTPPVGTMEMFGLAAGDAGIRAPTSFIQSATRTSGAMHLVLFRIIAVVNTVSSGIPNSIDVLTGGRPEILDDSVLQLLWVPSSTTSVNLSGVYNETHG